MITALGFGAAYSLLGLFLLVAGFYMLDLLTPGRLGAHLTRGDSFNAGVMVAAGFLGVGAILFTVIWHNAGAGLGPALGWTPGTSGSGCGRGHTSPPTSAAAWGTRSRS